MPDASLTVQIDGRDNLSGELKKIESSIIRFVGAMSSAFTAIAAVGFPIVEAAAFQKEILNAAKTTGFTREAIDQLSQSLRDLSNETNVTAVDLAKIATLGGQMGIGANDNAQALASFTKTTATAVTALGVSAEEVVNSFGKLVNIFNIPQEQFRNAMSAMIAVSNESTASAEQLFDVVRRIGTLGGSVKLPEAAGLSAAMIDLGLTAETAGTTLTKIFADFKSNAAAFAAVVRNDSIKTTEDWVNLVQGRGIDALNMYADALNKLSVADASALKGRLTGEGRLFEAISKIQAQRKLELNLVAAQTAAEDRLNQALADRDRFSDSAIAAMRAQAAALKESAEQASVIGRLTKKAQEAWTTGDVAEKAQKLVLSGLSAQWEVFVNNIKTLAAEAGTVFLPPLTDALKAASAALQNPVNAAGLKQAAKDIIEAIKKIGEAIDFLRNLFKGLESSGIDWGAALNTGALLVAGVAVKGILSLAGSISRTLLGGIPGFTALKNALLGVPAAAAGANASLNQTGNTATRVGGLFSDMAGRIGRSITATRSEIDRLNAAKARTEAAIGTRSAQASNALAANALILQQSQLRGLQSVAAISNEINRLQARQPGLMASGLSALLRQASAERAQIGFLQQQRTALEQNIRAAGVYNQRVAGLTGVLTRINQDLGRFNPVTRFLSFIAPIGEAGKKIGQSFIAGFQSGSTGPGVFGSFLAGAAGAVTSAAQVGQSIANFIMSPFKAVSSFSQTVFSSLRNGFGAVSNAVTSLGRNIQTAGAHLRTLSGPQIFAGMITGLGTMGTLIARMAAGGIGGTLGAIGGLFTGMAKGIGGVILSLGGLKQAYIDAGSTGSRAILGLTAGFIALGRGVAFVGGLLMGALNFVFIGMMIIQVLKAIGLWDKLAESIGKVIKAMGFSVPSFLQSDAEQRAAIRAANEITQAYKGAEEQASKMTEEMKSLILLSQQEGQVLEDITFNAEAPTAGLKQAAKYVEALVIGLSAVDNLEGRIDAKQVALTEAMRQQAKIEAQIALERGKKISQGTAEAGTEGGIFPRASANDFNKELAIAKAKVADLIDEIVKLHDKKDAFGDLAKGFKNVVGNAIPMVDAVRLLGKENENSLSVLEQYAVGLKNISKATADRTAAEEKFNNIQKSAPADEVRAANIERTEIVQRSTDIIEKNTKANKELRESTIALSTARPIVEQFFKSIDSNASAKGVDLTVAALQKLMKVGTDFKGVSPPSIKAENIVQAAAVFEVNRRFADMYGKWATLAATNAAKAKNFATEALSEFQRLAKETTAVIEKLTQRETESKSKAKNQLADRVDDSASRAIMKDIQTRGEADRKMIADYFSKKREALGDISPISSEMLQLDREEAIALHNLDEILTKLTDKEQDRLNIKKSRRNVDDELKQYDQLIAKVAFFKTQVEEANKTIADPNAKADEVAGALERREVALNLMKGAYGQVLTVAEKLSNVDPIGGQAVVTAAELAKIRISVQNASDDLGEATIAGADKIAGGWDKAAKGFTGKANEFADAANAAREQMANFGVPFDEAAVSMGRLLASSQAVRDVIEDLKNRTAGGVLDLGMASFAADAARAKADILEIGKTPKTLDIKLTEEGKGLADQITAAIKQGVKGVTPEEIAAATPTPVNVGVSPASIENMKSQISRDVSPDINVHAKIVDIKGSGTWTVAANARFGGLIGEAARFSERIASFANGAFVSGPGGPTDDRIPAWLSNGEYVIDAFTTSAFGPKFFSTVQQAARSGLSLNFMKNIKFPTFAGGGSVTMPSFVGFANDFKPGMASSETGVKDVVDINLTLGGQKVSLMGERVQVRKLVSAFKNFDGV